MVRILTIFVLGLLLIGGAYWLTTPYIKAIALYPQFRSDYENINLPGTLVASDVKDIGCNKYYGKFGPITRCRFIGYKIYKSRGFLEENILNADDQLVKIGFPPGITPGRHRNGLHTAWVNEIDTKTGELVQKGFTDLTSQTSKLNYYDIYSRENTYVYLFASNQLDRLSTDVPYALETESKFKIDSLFNNLGDQEYLYGVVVGKTYDSPLRF